MVTESLGRLRPFLAKHRKVLRIVILVLAVCALAAPVIVVGLSPGGFSPAGPAAIRLLGLYAFTLIFFNIMTGALAWRFYMIFNPVREYLFHIVAGTAGFSLAIAHGAVVFSMVFFRGFNKVWIVGPVALGLLALTISTAIEKERFQGLWRKIHVINYAIFVGIFIKAVIIGTDVAAPGTWAGVMEALMIVYVVLAAGATAVRLADLERQEGARREAAERAPD